jgi:TRAP-type C4-dicarboxylate transport system permease small subunit
LLRAAGVFGRPFFVRRRGLHVIQEINARIVRTLLLAAAAIILLLGFLVCADVIGRTVFNSPVKGTPEIVSMSIVVICFLLAGYAVQSGGMIYTDSVVRLFGNRGLAFGQLMSALLGILFFGLIVWGSYEPLLHAFASGEYEGEGALRVPAWPARTVVLIGSALVVITYVLIGIAAAKRLITGQAEPAAHPQIHR